jgi:hypothetical protein
MHRLVPASLRQLGQVTEALAHARPRQTPQVHVESLRVSLPDMDPMQAHQVTLRAVQRLADVLRQQPNLSRPFENQRTLDRLKLRLEITDDSMQGIESALSAAVERALQGAEE